MELLLMAMVVVVVQLHGELMAVAQVLELEAKV